ncbi:MAG: molybdenum cofactor guanylyltransferase [Bdellovibrionota bacterium]
MPSSRNSFSALVLCGGKSSRMGKNKAFLEVGGVLLIERVLQAAKEVAAEVLLIAPAEEEWKRFGFPVVTGERPGLGPLEALRAGLAAASNPAAYALSCDLPNLSGEPLRKMAALLGDAHVVVPRTSRGLEPLCALYRKECAAVFSAALERGERALHRGLEGLRVISPPLSELGTTDAFCSNLNTPEDLKGWRG